MAARDYLRLAGLGLRLSRKQVASIGGFQNNIAGPRKILYDLYHPRTNVRNTLILLHGGTLNGKDDPRLQHLARCLAATGSRCIVPTLPGLSRFQWTPSDIDGLAELVFQLTDEEKSIGLFGFSYGGSYALLLAADPRVAERIRFVLSFGAYHSLEDLYRCQLEFGEAKPSNAKNLDSWIYLRLAMAKRHAADIGLSDDVCRRLDDLLKRYCHASTAEEKMAFYQHYLRNEVLLEFENRSMDNTLLRKLSPHGKLKDLECSVVVFHDAADPLVPAEHAERIALELIAEGKNHRKIVTSLLNHVGFSNVFNLLEWCRIAACLAPVVRGFPGSP